MTNKKELTLLERFEQHAATPSVAKRVYNLVQNVDILNASAAELLAIPGMGRAAALMVMEVACDLAGKK